MRPKGFLMFISLFLIGFILMGCSDDKENSLESLADSDSDSDSDSDEDDEDFYDDEGNLSSREIEPEIYPIVSDAGDDFSVQINAADVNDDNETAHGRLVVNLENETEDPEEIKDIIEENSQIIADSLLELDVLDGVEIKWQLNYQSGVATYDFEREDDEMVQIDKKVKEESIEIYLKDLELKPK